MPSRVFESGRVGDSSRIGNAIWGRCDRRGCVRIFFNDRFIQLAEVKRLKMEKYTDENVTYSRKELTGRHTKQAANFNDLPCFLAFFKACEPIRHEISGARDFT